MTPRDERSERHVDVSKYVQRETEVEEDDGEEGEIGEKFDKVWP